MSRDLPRQPREVRALLFLDRHTGDWYCTHCWADAVGSDVRTLHRLSIDMGTSVARAAGYEAKADGPCVVHDAKGSRAAGAKGPRSVRSLAGPRRDRRRTKR